MITPKELASAYALDVATAKEQTEGLTHADSVVQPPVQGNCLNWVMGHVLDTRNDVLKLLGEPAILTAAQAKRYGYGSEPVCGEGPIWSSSRTCWRSWRKARPASRLRWRGSPLNRRPRPSIASWAR
jgi:hypothetical protein